MIESGLYEMVDREPPPRAVVRVNWFRVGLALVLPAALVAFSFSDSRIQIQVVSGGAPAPPADAAALQLVTGPVSQWTDGRSPMVPLGISVHGPAELASAATVEIVGLPGEWSVSAGRAIGDRWRIPATQLSGLVALPPRGFSGGVDIAAELRRADDTLVDRRPIRLTITTSPPEPVAAAPPEPAVTAAAEKKTLPEQLTPEKATLLLNKAQLLLAQHDISAARLMLRHLAEAGDAHAAMLLGETYERCVHYPAHCSTDSDPAVARSWYEKAAKLGSDEARRRLDHFERGDGLPPAQPLQHASTLTIDPP